MTRAMLILVALALAGCVSVLPEARPPAPRFLLEAATYDEAGGTAVSWTLAVDDPASTRVYDSQRIALIRERGRVDYLANGEWADRGPRLVQAALVRSFENTSRILGVADRASIAGSDFVLQTDIRALHADYTQGAPAATVAVYARLTSARGKVLAARLFEQRALLRGSSPSAIAAGFDEAVSKTLADMVEWTLVEGERVYAK